MAADLAQQGRALLQNGAQGFIGLGVLFQTPGLSSCGMSGENGKALGQVANGDAAAKAGLKVGRVHGTGNEWPRNEVDASGIEAFWPLLMQQ
jgi:hypothetical protein